MEKGIIFNLQKFCIHDGDGIRTCVFLKGCPLNCIWCHNPEGLSNTPTLSFNKEKCTLCGKCLAVCPNRKIENGRLCLDRGGCTLCGKCTTACLSNANEIIGRSVTPQEVLEEALKDKIFYDQSNGGITITGGEPSLQSRFTLELLRLARDAGISTAIETCGVGSRDFYKTALELGATFLFDIKCVDPTLHKRLTGVDNSHILASLAFLLDNGADVIIRLPLIPTLNDSNGDLLALGELLNTQPHPWHRQGAKARRSPRLQGKQRHKRGNRPLAQAFS